MKKTPRDGIPGHLSAEARALWQRLAQDFELQDGAAHTLLRALCESFDRAEEARRILSAEGMTTKDRFGQSKPHPLLAVERDSRAAMISAIRALRLSPEVL